MLKVCSGVANEKENDGGRRGPVGRAESDESLAMS